MNVIGGFVIAFSMYSRIPMPHISWTKENMKYAMWFFPMVGAVIGCLYPLWGLAVEHTGGSVLWYSLVGTAIPLLVTGGIHMDGFLDVTDARASFQDREKKLEIMKDPHTGAFAIIGCGVYLLLYAGFFAELPARWLPALAGVPVLSRSFSGLSVLLFPKAKKEGLAASFSTGSKKTEAVAVLTVWGLAAFVWLWMTAGGVTASSMLAAGLLVFAWYFHLCRKEFGGVTGDLAGYFLQLFELILLAVMVLELKVWG